MNFLAVEAQFKPVSPAQVDALAREFVRRGLVERSVSLEEVGLVLAAHKVVRKGVPALKTPSA